MGKNFFVYIVLIIDVVKDMYAAKTSSKHARIIHGLNFQAFFYVLTFSRKFLVDLYWEIVNTLGICQ